MSQCSMADNRPYCDYSKPKGFNTENEVLTTLLKGLNKVFWAGPLRATTRNHYITGSKETATWATIRKLGTKKTAPQLCFKYQKATLRSAGYWVRPYTKKMHTPSRLSPSLLHSAFKPLMNAFDWLNLNYIRSFCSKGHLRNVLLSFAKSAIQKVH